MKPIEEFVEKMRGDIEIWKAASEAAAAAGAHDASHRLRVWASEGERVITDLFGDTLTGT